MSHIVVWSPRSLECVQRLYSFLAEKDTDVAKAAALLFKQAELLEHFPNVGRPAEDLFEFQIKNAGIRMRSQRKLATGAVGSVGARGLRPRQRLSK